MLVVLSSSPLSGGVVKGCLSPTTTASGKSSRGDGPRGNRGYAAISTFRPEDHVRAMPIWDDDAGDVAQRVATTRIRRHLPDRGQLRHSDPEFHIAAQG